MSANTVAFFSVIFPNNIKFFEYFIDSLTKQSYSKFDLVLVNDGCESLDRILASFPEEKLVLLSCDGTPAGIREFGLNYLRSSGYEYAIFGDTDDTFSENRVEAALDLLESRHLVVNDIDLTDVDGKKKNESYIGKRFGKSFDFTQGSLENYNFAGLGNSAMRLSGLPAVKIPPDLLAVDWFFFTKYWSGEASFTSEAKTFYRQYGANSVGLGTVSEESVLRSLNVKLKHYETLSVDSGVFKTKSKRTRDTIEAIRSRAIFEEYYKKVIRFLPANPLWWEEGMLFEEFDENTINAE
ncbi:glycosyltransferase family 2 protein [Leptospira gomenensis]|uniref:Glycosyltransferase family 2 protein n=1 Tax=Leptospira gomenensis TaxID=2484974 RepID=A0A5F1Z1M2_9LEPT|nr:glycosyltransferase family A protein [Leptospira gomenensis]TGK30939.1 glycosyltransferase family 2 protein [Leptospira gomenensis]TGK38181.1 glycosyltransferase family 2 protein [Leptospira gomenensis]TGK45341.1 glycosyltransferase family 2 protein [Leptospira gomenensis]TGK66254.1 glycosyltransferase family 2 protein [Leptospira gomenensis]